MKILKIIYSLILILFIGVTGKSQTFIDWNAEYLYFKGTAEPSQPNSLWRDSGFNTVGWETGNTPFQYGKGSNGTVLADMQYKYATVYLRKTFEYDGIDEIENLIISIDYDDGFIIWLNGEQILAINAPANVSHDKLAPTNHDSGIKETYLIKNGDFNLNQGTNIVAIQCFNASTYNADFYIDLKIEGEKALPKTEKVSIDVASGFYYEGFTATINAAQAGETITYTLDGSDPRTSSDALTGFSPVYVPISPNSTMGGRGKTGGFVLRATAVKDGYKSAIPETRNYIFVNYVKTQAAPGGNWPTSNVNGQVIDLTMDSKIYDDNRYKNQMESSLLDIPTISISTDMDNLFGSEKGIYVNAKYHGSDWERPANIELINPDGSPGFNTDAGIRIRGGWSRHNNYPKHAFRVFFRSEYGDGKLDFPLFGSEGVDEFDKIDLRCSQNYSWANGGGDSRHNTMNRDVFSRDTQRDMNQPYTRSRYYHLYLNGLYWGVYQTQERAEADFAESYFGGDKDDYDVIKVDIGENWNLYEIEATNGNTDAWEEIWKLCEQGFATNTNYFKILGLNSEGKRDPSLNVMIDIDNFIDYMLTIFYTGNFDAPVSKFSNNYNPNNFFAIYNRNNKNEGFKFLTHDSEHTLLADPAGPGIGLNENRVSINMNVGYFGKFHPQWLHKKLTENEEYKVKFADRVYRHFFNHGVFVPDSCIARFKRTADPLDLAVIAESARWGDQGSWPARNKLDDWVPAVNRVINDYMPYRTDIVLQQLLNAGLFNDRLPPVFKNQGIELKDIKITISGNYDLLIENPNSNGTIVYTSDGTDPRDFGGTKSATAESGGNSINISIKPGTVVRARIQNRDLWSPLHEIEFEDSGLFTHLKVTELHYHPLDQGEVDHKELEFIELKNTGSTTLDLSGLAFTDGIEFTFPEGTMLAPNSFVVIASNMAEFNTFYGFPANFGYSGSLSNGGEKIDLKTAGGDIVISFTYSDEPPWPVEADGGGYSLVSYQQNPTGDPNNVEYWTISKYENGSPGVDDEMSIPTGTEIIASKPVEFNVYPNPASSIIYLDFSLEENENIEVNIYDINGRLMHQLINEQITSGFYNRYFQIDNLGLSPGIYLIAFKTKSSFETRKLIYSK